MTERELVWNWQLGMTANEVAEEANVTVAVVQAAIDSYMMTSCFEEVMGLDLA